MQEMLSTSAAPPTCVARSMLDIDESFDACSSRIILSTKERIGSVEVGSTWPEEPRRVRGTTPRLHDESIAVAVCALGHGIA